MEKLSQKKKVQLNRRCPLCQHQYSFNLLSLSYALFADSPLSPTVKLVACENCGFVFYDTPSTESDFDRFYQDHYFIHAYDTSHDYHENDEYYNFLLEVIARGEIDSSSTIVDVGCGQGQLLRALSLRGFNNLTGIELCEDYVGRHINDAYTVCHGSALVAPDFKIHADLLIYKHIFEHFFSPNAAVSTASKMLALNGYVMVAVPDASLYNSFDEYSPLNYFTLEHINHFDVHHIESLFGFQGFEMVFSSTRMLDIKEDFPVPIMYCLFRKQKYKQHKIQKNFELAENMLNWFDSSDSLNTEKLEVLKKNQQDVYVWGISYRTTMHLAMSQLKNCNIKGFVDIDPRKQGKVLLGKEIQSPDVLNFLNEKDVVVIGVGPSSLSMYTMLRQIGFKGEIIRLQ